jgi:hypothetical protein
MRRALQEISTFYAANKTEISTRSAATLARQPGYTPAPREDLNDSMIAGLIEALTEGFDDEFGGFGNAPKFPQPELLEFLLAEWRASNDPRIYAMVAKTLLGMSRGGTYDHVEGGFFRYSTTRDWSVPHFEKMAEDHAGLLRVLAQLAIAAPTDEFHATLASAVGYVRTTLRDPLTGFFAGSQDADEEYFAQPLDERRRRTAPFVDRTSYTNWTCALAGAWFFAALALDDDDLLREACQTLDTVHERLIDEDGLAFHFIVPGGTAQVRGLLTDQSAYLRALIDGHELSGHARFVERAQALADRILDRFEADDGGFCDHIPLEPQIGRLDVADRPLVENGLLAESLLRLSALTGRERYRESAERALALYARTYAAAGSFAATYGRALRRYLAPEVTVRVVGDPDATAGFREAAVRLPTPTLAVRTIDPGSAGELDLPSDPYPAAYVCSGRVCGAPARDPGGLRAAYDRLQTAPGAP